VFRGATALLPRCGRRRRRRRSDPQVLQRVASRRHQACRAAGELCTDNGAMIAWPAPSGWHSACPIARIRAPRPLALTRLPDGNQAGAHIATGRMTFDASRCWVAAPGHCPRKVTARAAAASRCGSSICQAEQLTKQRESRYLPGLRIEDSITVTRDLAEASRAEAILLVCRRRPCVRSASRSAPRSHRARR